MKRLIITAEIEVDDDKFTIDDMTRYKERDDAIKDILSNGSLKTSVVMAVTDSTNSGYSYDFAKRIDNHIEELKDFRKSGTDPRWKENK